MDPMESIKATFFQECDELLADLEAGLLSLQTGSGDDDTVNAVFRAVHSVKGGAGAFGLEQLVRFAHVFETTLDHLRSGRLSPEPEVLKVLLRAADVLADQVAAAQAGEAGDQDHANVLSRELEALHGETPPPPTEVPPPISADDDIDGLDFTPLKLDLSGGDDTPVADDGQAWSVHLRPAAAMYAKANDPHLLLRELERLGACEIELQADYLPGLDMLDPDESYLAWSVRLTTSADEAAIREVFEFVEADCELAVAPVGASEAEAGVEAEGSSEIDFILRQALASVEPAVDPEPPAPPVAVATSELALPDPPPAPAEAAAKSADPQGAHASAGNATIRVDLDRIDRLINLVGELVINQAMLAQRVSESGAATSSSITMGLDELEQLTREIQDSVMAIRAQPVKSVFQRMPRLAREVAAMTGKQVRLVTEGENTEVDKTVIERLGDPITHMLRNAIDHGLERPDMRTAAGKSPEGVVRLSALHRGGRIVIEVADDGAGIDRKRVREIAVSKGLVSADDPMTDEEIDNLIFMPGFSTASTVSDISGRGVGMDVVRRSIQALGGRISITSRPGEGSTFTLSLPLTLAVLDGMVVSVGEQILIVPLTSIVETLQLRADQVQQMGARDAVIRIRDAFVPLIDVGGILGWRNGPPDPASCVVLLVESEVCGHAALLVDLIQGQRQVVIKSLEANYQRVEGIAAATILGDGRVALILDVDAAIGLRRRAGQKLEIAPLVAA